MAERNAERASAGGGDRPTVAENISAVVASVSGSGSDDLSKVILSGLTNAAGAVVAKLPAQPAGEHATGDLSQLLHEALQGSRHLIEAVETQLNDLVGEAEEKQVGENHRRP